MQKRNVYHSTTGKLYDAETQLICGLRPAHFITLATPHLGCDAKESPAQVTTSLVLHLRGIEGADGLQEVKSVIAHDSHQKHA
jgi:hypothetical protein